MNKNLKNALLLAGVLSAITTPSVKASEHIIVDTDTAINQDFNDYSSSSPQYGGAVYNNGANLTVSGGDFTGNVINGEGQTSVYGGAIASNGGSLTIYDDVSFTGNSTNSAGASGGGALALQNGSTATIGNNVDFDSNSSFCGGAIYTATNDTVIGNGSSFTGNSAGFAGGAIYNGSSASGTANMNIGSGTTISGNDAQYGGGIYNLGYGGEKAEVNIGSVNMNGNTASKDGGAIYNDVDSNAGDSVISVGGGSSFTNNTAGGNGGAVYNNGTFKMDTTDGDITFSGNTAGGKANDIYQAEGGVTVITGTGNTITMNGGFAGKGEINKTGDNNLVLNSDNSGFTGEFNQSDGKTVSNGKFFGGTNTITNSEVELGNNGELVKDSSTDLTDSGTLTVSGDNVKINGEIKGEAGSEINKTAGSGSLTIDGNEGAKTSDFHGEFNQAGGTTTVKNTTLFENTTISGGSVTLDTNSNIAANGNINLSGSGAVLNNTAANTNTITFTADSTISGVAGSQFNNSGNVSLNGTDTSGFLGDYVQNGGSTNVVNSDLFANTTVNGGSITLGTGAGVASSGSINLANAGTVLNVNADAKTINFTNDYTISGAEGSKLNNAGNIVLNNTDTSGFDGDYTQTGSGTITVENSNMFENSTINGGSVTLKNGGQLVDNSNLALNGTDTKLNIEGTGDHAFKDVDITGNGQINNSSSGKLDLQGDYSGFDGKYNQTAGKTEITGTDADNVSTMFKNVTLSGENTELKLGDFSTLAEGGSVNLTDKSTLTFAGEQILNNNTIVGSTDSFVKKEGTGKLTINNSDYSGFEGTYQQTEGLTVADHTAFFSNLDITGGELQLINGSVLNSSETQNNLNFGAKLTLDSSSAKFNGTGTTTFEEEVNANKSELIVKEGAVFEKDVTSTSSKIEIGKNADFNGNLTSTGTADAASSIKVGGNLTVADGKNTQLHYTVTDVVGDAIFGGTLDTKGAEGAYSSVKVGGNMSVNNDASTKMEYASAEVTGDMNLTGTSDFNNSFVKVGGDSIFGKAFNAVSSVFNLEKNATFNDNVSIKGTADAASGIKVGGDMSVNNDGSTNIEYTNVQVTGDMTLTGTSDFNNSVVKVGGDSIFGKAFNAVSSAFNLEKNATFNDDVSLTGTTDAASSMTVGGDLNMGGSSVFENAIVKVDGNATFGTPSPIGPIASLAAGVQDVYTNAAISIAGTADFNNEVSLDKTTIVVGDNASFKENVTAQDTLMNFGKDVSFENGITTRVNELENNIISVAGNLTSMGPTELNNTIANITGNASFDSGAVLNNTKMDVESNFTANGDVNLTDSSLTILGTTDVQNGDTTITNSQLNLKGDANFQQDLTIGENSVLKFLDPTSTFNVDGTFKVHNGTVDVMNNVLNNNIINNDMIIDGKSAFAIDIDARGWKSDTFTMNGDISAAGGAGGPDAYITIADFNLTSVPIDRNIYLPNLFMANGTIADNVHFLDSEMSKFTPIGWYQMQGAGLGNTSGYRLSLIKYNPQVFRGQVATVANYQNQLVTNNILFDHIQEVSLRYLAEENPNTYAAAYPQFAPYQYDKKDGSLWFKAYGSLETLSMTQGLNVENNFYGVLTGADFPVIKMKNGWSLLPTAYVGYNGAHQVFNQVGMTQNGGQGGAMATFMKDRFIGSILAYGGGYGNQMDVAGTTDNTANWYAGTAAKAAYNFRPSKHFIIQPTALVSYNFFGKQNWHTNFGDMAMNSGYMNGINVAPGINFIYGRESWSVYATAQYFYNIMGSSNGRAGNVDLPGVSMRHGFLEYGIGFTKTFKDRLSAYLQITLRNGGRTGVGFQGGLQYKI